MSLPRLWGYLCLQSAKLASIDGILWDGTVADLNCSYGVRGIVQRMEINGNSGDFQRVQGHTKFCKYEFFKDNIRFITTLKVPGTLTQEQADACFAAAYDSCDL